MTIAALSSTDSHPAWLHELADWIAGLDFARFPDAVTRRTRYVLLDSLGAIAAGAQEPEMKTLTARLLEGRAEAGSAVIGAGRRASQRDAALLNGIAGTMLELDEGNQFARGHPAIHVVPAVLAEANRLGASGRDVVTALVVGYEIGARVGIAAKLRPTMHPHGTWGTIGAAAAIAKLNRAGAAAIRETINVSSTLGLATSRRTMLEGGTVRNSFAGIGNTLGILAWDLAASGFVGETDGVRTVYDTVIADRFDPREMTAELGQRYEIARNYFKRHACCRYNHAALDALAAILARRGGRLDPAAIARIDVATYSWAAQLSDQEPRNMLAAKFSLPFSIATTIVNGGATVTAFRLDAQRDATIRGLARRVFVAEDEALTAMLPGKRPARLVIAFNDGNVETAETFTNRGDSEDPYTEAEIEAKFLDLAIPVWGEAAARQVRDQALGIDAQADIAALDRLIMAGA